MRSRAVHGTNEADRRKLVVSEVFGPTFQGEGPSIGRLAWFVRLGGCNLSCVWCDTPYTWDWTGKNGHVFDPRHQLTHLSIDQVSGLLPLASPALMVITGGEPLLQQSALVPFLGELAAAKWDVEIETAGTIAPLDRVTQLVTAYNVSPKLSNSRNRLDHRYKPDAIDRLQASGKARWKFVVQSCDDLQEIEDLAIRHDLRPVYIMPEGTAAPEILLKTREISEAVLSRGWNITSRLHVLVYGNERGI